MILTLDSPKLRQLSRAQLQSLAKREVVRAVGKTEDIICRLMNKHPKGVPAVEEDKNVSASSAPRRQHFVKKAHKETPARSPVPDPPHDRVNFKDKGRAIIDTTSPSASSSTEALELLYPEDEPVAGPSREHPKSVSASSPQVPASEALPDRAPAQHPSLSGKPSPVPPSEHPPHETNDEEGTRSAAPPLEVPIQGHGEEDEAYNYVKGAPSHYMVLDALRQLTTLTNTIPIIETRIAESRCLLQRTESMLQDATPDARELCVTREYLETIFLAKMKQKRELWDGTGRMDKVTRKARMDWLRGQRRKAAEKKWAEVNEVNRMQGHKPEPLSAFLVGLESDEEEVESLQTTPTSSRGGNTKRAREESGIESEANSGGSESQKKRARA